MKTFLPIIILLISSALFASSSSCKVNIEFNSLMGTKRKGIERLIRRTLKDKGYQVNKRNFSYPDYSLQMGQGSVCTQLVEGVTIFEEIFSQVVFGSMASHKSGDEIKLEGWGETRVVGEILGLGLREAIKDALIGLPNCNEQ
jgi:hypothetical protein